MYNLFKFAIRMSEDGWIPKPNIYIEYIHLVFLLHSSHSQAFFIKHWTTLSIRVHIVQDDYNYKMPRPIKLNEDLVAELVQRYNNSENQASQNDLVQYCATLGVEVNVRTIRRVLHEHNAKKNYERLDTPELRLRIAALFFQESLEDEQILSVLRQEGFKLSNTHFVQTRIAMGIKKRTSWEEAELRNEEFKRIISAELDRGEIGNYGRSLLYTHFRTTESLQLLISRYENII